MGYLHDGHLSLIRTSASLHLFTVVSIFVNPLQFGPNEDYDAYPRTEDRDFALAQNAGADLVWFPRKQDIYASQSETTVLPGSLAHKLCGLSRPAFFGGIATVVLKLFNIMGPCHSFFGEKDYQQLTILRRMVLDFFVPVKIVACPTVREADGLAMSSRNVHLKPKDRHLALSLIRSINMAQEMARAGQLSCSQIRHSLIEQWPAGIELDYMDFRDDTQLANVERVEPSTRLFVGAWLNGVRLIDNASLWMQQTTRLQDSLS